LNASTAKVAVVFGGPSPEHDVSILTGLQAARALAGAGRAVTCLYWAKTGDWYQVAGTLEAADFADGVPRGAEGLRLVLEGDGSGFESLGGRLGRARPLPVDVVLNCCHGGPGEDGTLQGVLDLAGVPYTGPTLRGAALGMDKLAFCAVAEAAELPVLPRRSLEPTTSDVGAPGPYIVKPRFGGSSIGIDVVADLPTARARLDANVHLRPGAVIEPYRGDLYDLNVAVRSWPEPELSAIERPLRSSVSGEILDYADKYVGGEGMASAPRELPAALDPALAATLRDLALRVARLAQVRGVARIDFLCDGAALFVNEVNTVPGSLARYLWVAPPLAFVDLLDAMIAEALSGPAASHTAAGADGTVLRSAGGIAAKLA